jgi:predicted nucleotidyltransferase
VAVVSLRLGKVGEKIYEALTGVEDVVVYVFGSFAEGREHTFSDVDVAVLFEEPSVDKVIKVHSLLVELFGDRVDTLPLNFAPPFLRYVVIKNG